MVSLGPERQGQLAEEGNGDDSRTPQTGTGAAGARLRAARQARGLSQRPTAYDTAAAGHLEVAAAVQAGLAGAGVASEPAALAYGLAFIPLTAERFDLIIPASMTTTREFQGLLRVLSSSWLLSQLASLPGYDVTQCGERRVSLSPT